MIVTNLSGRLFTALSDAKEVWIATALANEVGFQRVKDAMPQDTIQHLLVGVNLPTTIGLLRMLRARVAPGHFEARMLHCDEGIFHPKLYLVRNESGYRAFVGSSNLTEGGLSQNIELSLETDNSAECNQLLEWFHQHYEIGYPLTETNLECYERFLRSSGQPAPTTTPISLTLEREEAVSDLFGGLDFSDRYFKKEHHLAFREGLWQDDSREAYKERKAAEKRFRELHDEIFPQFQDNSLDNLYPNTKNHLVSMAYHFPDRPKQRLNAMWLSYGKNAQEIKAYHDLFQKNRYDDEEDDRQSFINHARLQIRIELKEIGIWILFGKNNGGSLFDRDYFRTQMRNPSYRKRFFDELKKLPAPYWILVNGEPRDAEAFTDPDELYAFCRKDNSDTYFIIGRDYAITDPEMSETNLPQTALQEFNRLNPLYKMMRHYLGT